MNPKPSVTIDHSENEDGRNKRKIYRCDNTRALGIIVTGDIFRLGLSWYRTHPTNPHRVISSKKTNLRFSSPPVQPRGILSDRRTASIQVLSPSAYPEVCS
jgi:hypothetical protein